MTAVTVHASKEYDVLIGDNLLKNIGTYVKQIKNQGKIAIISDSNVWPLYGESAKSKLTDAGFDVVVFVFPAGEASKNAETYLNIVNFLAENHITRSDALIALGGGVVGDITGFAAATFLRGISYIQIPTTLLSMVDSSVGGKTAIDLPAGKNLIGAFYQPELVLCDCTTLTTLPDAFFYDGCAEVIKYGILFDPQLFTHLEDRGPAFDRNYVISRCVALKRDVVEADEYDTGLRQKLNLGHTIGHAVEAISRFGISHGNGVAIGMSIVTKAAAAKNICDRQLYPQLVSVLRKFQLPTEIDYSVDAIVSHALSDKKRSGDTLNLIIPESIGNCLIQKISVSELKAFIEPGL